MSNKHEMRAFVHCVYAAKGVEPRQHRDIRWSVHWSRTYLLPEAVV